mgnify:CR=1 FL=1
MSRTESHLQRQTGILNDIKASVGKVTTGSPALSVPSVQNVGIFGSNGGTEWKPVEVSATGAMKVDLDLSTDGISLEATQIEVRDRLPTAVTASGNLKVSIEEGAIPAITGFATEAKQDLMITDLGVIKGDTTSIDGKITACDTGAVVVSGSALPTGASTEAKQNDINTKLDTIINNTEKLAPSYSRTEALPVQLVCGSVGANYNSLRAIGQDLGVYIDDMNPDVAVSSGLSTAVLQTTANGLLATIDADTGSIDGKIIACNTGAVVVASGAITETNSGAIATDVAALEVLSTAANGLLTTIAGDTTSLDSKILVGNDDDLTTSQQVLAYGKGSDGDLHPISTTPSGVIKTEEVLTWNTHTLLSVVAIAGGATGTTSTLDLGTDIHVPKDITIYLINSAQVTSTIQAQSSIDGGTWYTSINISPVFSTGRNRVFSLVNDLGTPVGRYLRFEIANTSASSSNYSVTAGEYNGG